MGERKVRIDLTGKRFGHLTVISYSHTNKKTAWWNCVCDCGNLTCKPGTTIKAGYSTSCGCVIKRGVNHITHGLTKSRIYSIWRGMKSRCDRPKHRNYNHYGGRGIKVCKRWYKFENFLEDMGHPPGEKYTLDRIDNDKGYSKKNCRWATQEEQHNNKRTNKFLTFNGETRTIVQWARYLGIPKGRIVNRIRYGYSLENVLSLDRFNKTRKR